MYYPDDLIREIRENSDIVSVISEYMTLTKKGNNHFGLCPFHGEKTASFSVNEREQFFHCFGCGAGGNVFTFLMQMENMTFVEAVKHLADRAHITLPEVELSPQEKRRLLKRERMMEATKEAARYYYYQLAHTPAGGHARAYLAERKVTDEYMRRFGLGYAPVSREGLSSYLLKKGYDMEELLGAGLVAGKEGRVYDRFFNRLMFPIFDTAGRPIAFGGRVMGQGEPKYLNSSESEIFNKRRNLYGMSIAKKTRRNYLLIVEGYMDVLSLHQAGFDNAVASLGTALTKEQSLLMKRYTDEVVLCYDSDGAGTGAARRAIPILEDAGLNVRVIRVPGAKDPDEFIKEKGAESFETVVQQAMNPVDFEMLVLQQQYGTGTVDGQVKTLKDMAQRLADILNDAERELHIRDVAQKLRVSEGSLKAEVEGIRANKGLIEHQQQRVGRARGAAAPGKPTGQELHSAGWQLLSALLHEPSLFKVVNPYVSEEDFGLVDNFERKVADYVFGCLKAGRRAQSADLISRFDEAADQEKAAALADYALPKEEEDLSKTESMAGFSLPEKQEDLQRLLTETVRSLKEQRLDELMDTLGEQGDWNHIIEEKRYLQNLQVKLT